MAMTEVAPDVGSASLKQISTNLPNIQGNVFGGFFKDHQVFLFLRLPDPKQAPGQARAWLTDLIDDIATAEEVIAFNNLFKLAKNRHHGREGVVKATWTNVAFTFKGLKALGVPPEELSFPEEFAKGMAARAAEIGDVDKSEPAKWIPPLRVKDPTKLDDPNIPDAILLVASDDPEDLEAEVARLAEALDDHGIETLYRQKGESRSGIENGENQRGHEHFGFDDGVSQPGVRDDRVTPPGIDADTGLPGQDRLWPGEWVLGYPKQTGKENKDQSPDKNPGHIANFGEPDWANDGSYLVFRRLHQDVKGFRDFVDHQAKVEGITSSVMGAKIVGRYTSGCPLELADGQADNFDPTKVDPSKADPTMLNPERINAFDYESDNPLRDDKDGLRVPRAAHIRKVYPRNERPPTEAAAETRRILRRGIQFGKSFDRHADPDSPTGANAAFPDDRGLCFLCYQSSIKDKFEFLMRRWVDNESFPQVVNGVKDGFDLVISQTQDPRHFNLPGGKVPAVSAPARWVITSGGGYFFQPSITGLRHLAGLDKDDR
jgi:Dyp-type peroxidase family